jgi:hypothetical protein
MCIGCTDPVRCVEGNPTELGDESFCPGVAGILVGNSVGPPEITADVACRDTLTARGSNEDVRQVLADAALEGKSLYGGGPRVSWIRIIDHALVQPFEQNVQQQAARRRFPLGMRQ